jgi:hypothetical protein
MTSRGNTRRGAAMVGESGTCPFYKVVCLQKKSLKIES